MENNMTNVVNLGSANKGSTKQDILDHIDDVNKRVDVLLSDGLRNPIAITCIAATDQTGKMDISFTSTECSHVTKAGILNIVGNILSLDMVISD